jgi:hypothetical protein
MRAILRSQGQRLQPLSPSLDAAASSACHVRLILIHVCPSTVRVKLLHVTTVVTAPLQTTLCISRLCSEDLHDNSGWLLVPPASLVVLQTCSCGMNSSAW